MCHFDDIKDELDKICLEEDYQSDMNSYIDNLIGEDVDKPIPYDEFMKRSKLIAQRMKQWNQER